MKKFFPLLQLFLITVLSSKAQFYHELIKEYESANELHIADLKEGPYTGINIALWNKNPFVGQTGNRTFTLASYSTYSNTLDNELLFEQDADKEQEAAALCFKDKVSIFLTGKVDVNNNAGGTVFLSHLDLTAVPGSYGLATHIWGHRYFFTPGDKYRPVDIYYNDQTKNIWLLVEKENKCPVVLVIDNGGNLVSAVELYAGGGEIEYLTPHHITGVPGGIDEVYITCAGKLNNNDPNGSPFHVPVIFRLSPANGIFQVTQLNIPSRDDPRKRLVRFFEAGLVGDRLYYGISYSGFPDLEGFTHVGEIARDLSFWSTIDMHPMRITDMDFSKEGFAIAGHGDWASRDDRMGHIMKLDPSFNMLWHYRYPSIHTGFGPGGKVLISNEGKRHKFMFDHWGADAIDDSYTRLNELWADEGGALSADCYERPDLPLTREDYTNTRLSPIAVRIEPVVGSYEWNYQLNPYNREVICGYHPDHRPAITQQVQNTTNVNISVMQNNQQVTFKQTGLKENAEIRLYDISGRLLSKTPWLFNLSTQTVARPANNQLKMVFFRITNNSGTIFKSGSLFLP